MKNKYLIGVNMNIKKLRKNINQEFKMNKYDLFTTMINEIGDFPVIISGFYLDNTGYDSDEYLGFKINSGWNDNDETATYISKFHRNIRGDANEIRVYYTYEEFLHYFLTYYLENIHCYANMISFIEQEFLNYTRHIDNAKEYKIRLNVMDIFKKDKLRNFLLEYNIEENKYLYGFINHYNEYINYWDINILKKFMSYLLGKDILKKFFQGRREFKIGVAYYFGDRGYSEGYNIKIEKDISINYYTEIDLGKYRNVIDKLGITYRAYNISDILSEEYAGNFVTKEETDKFVKERFKGTRDKMNVEVVSKQDFIKELKIVVNAYGEIYKDNEVKGMFEKFKEELGE